MDSDDPPPFGLQGHQDGLVDPAHLFANPVWADLEEGQPTHDEGDFARKEVDCRGYDLEIHALRVATTELEQEFPTRGGLGSLAHNSIHQSRVTVHQCQGSGEVASGNGRPEDLGRSERCPGGNLHDGTFRWFYLVDRFSDGVVAPGAGFEGTTHQDADPEDHSDWHHTGRAGSRRGNVLPSKGTETAWQKNHDERRW